MVIQFPKLHSGQMEILNSTRRYKVVAAGRRWGKTRLCSAIAVARATNGKRVWWVAPTYPVGGVGWRQIKNLAMQIPGMAIKESERMAYIHGGFVQVKSADNPDRLRGEGLDLVIVDEAAHIRNLRDTWEQSLRPSLSDRKGGAIFISTPKGFDFFYELYKQPEKSWDWRSFHYPTSSSPYIDAKEIEAAKDSLPALVFRQEYGAEFVQLSGAMFRREWFKVVDKAPPLKSIARGWDLAASTKTSNDYTVGAKVGFTKDGGLCLLDVVRGRWEWPEALRVIANTAKADGASVTQVVEDNGQQKAALQLLRREQELVHIPFRGVTEILRKPMGDKVSRANTWLPRAEQSMVSLVRGNWNGAALDVLCSFPEGAHDDDVDAISAAVIALSGASFWSMNPGE